MVSFLKFAFLALTVSVVPAFADYATVLSDLKSCDAIAQRCLTLCNSSTGGPSPALASCVSDLDNCLKQTAKDVNASTATTSAQAQSVLDYINNTLLPDLKALLTCIKSKRAAYTAAGLKSTVLADLKELKQTGDSLFSTLIAKAPSSSLKSGAQTAQSSFDAAMQDAISYYS